MLTIYNFPLRSQDPNQLDWQRHNDEAADSRYHRNEIIASRAKLAFLQKEDFDDVGFYPFKIYSFPSGWRANANISSDWLKFRVHAGRYQGVLVSNTDAHDNDPNGATYPQFPDDDAPLAESDCTDIVLAANTAQTWFWVDVSNAAAPTVRHSAHPPNNGWSNFPNVDSTHVPIGWVDTQFDQANSNPVIRQLVRTDISSAGGGGSSSGMNYQGTYNSSATYHIGDVVRKQSGGSLGVWVCVINNPGGSNAPTWPEPATTGGTNYWELLSLGPVTTAVCSNGSKSVDLNATTPY